MCGFCVTLFAAVTRARSRVVSSHLLQEVEQTRLLDDVVIIANGLVRLILAG